MIDLLNLVDHVRFIEFGFQNHILTGSSKLNLYLKNTMKIVYSDILGISHEFKTIGSRTGSIAH